MDKLNEEDVSEVILSKVDPELELPADVYIKVDNKFIMFRKEGDPFTSEKFDQFISKGMSTVYVKNEDIMDFLEWISESAKKVNEELISEAGEGSREAIEKTAQIKEVVYETFFDQDLNQENVSKIQENVSDFISNIKEDPITVEAINALAKRNATIADHSVNVANLSVYLAMVMGHGHQFILENVYLGSVFHDYGKAKIPESVLNNSSNQMYSQAIQDHPEKSVKIISKSKGIPDPVFQIILQHHEQYNGYGYPAGLEGDEIYDLAAIVSIANTFYNVLEDNPSMRHEEKCKKAIKYIEVNAGRIWNPKFFPRCLEALKFAFIKE